MVVSQNAFCGKLNWKKELSGSFFINALQKTPSLPGAECQCAGTTPLHANERGQTVRFVAIIESSVYRGIFMWNFGSYSLW